MFVDLTLYMFTFAATTATNNFSVNNIMEHHVLSLSRSVQKRNEVWEAKHVRFALELICFFLCVFFLWRKTRGMFFWLR